MWILQWGQTQALRVSPLFLEPGAGRSPLGVSLELVRAPWAWSWWPLPV